MFIIARCIVPLLTPAGLTLYICLHMILMFPPKNGLLLDAVIQHTFRLSINHALSLTNQNQLITVRGGGGPVTHALARFT